MSEAFDPYYQWLSIPPREQPPNHYRLLGLRLYEENAEVIARAAERQAAFVRTFQFGPHTQLTQKLLNEIAAAKICLTHPEKRKAYDEQLTANNIRKQHVEPVVKSPQKSIESSSTREREFGLQTDIGSGDLLPSWGHSVHISNLRYPHITTSDRFHARRVISRVSSIVIYMGIALACAAIALLMLRSRDPEPGISLAHQSERDANSKSRDRRIDPSVDNEKKPRETTPRIYNRIEPNTKVEDDTPFAALSQSGDNRGPNALHVSKEEYNRDPGKASDENANTDFAATARERANVQTPEKDPLEELPSHLQLPPIDETHPVHLGEFRRKDNLQVECVLLGPHGSDMHNPRFLLTPELSRPSGSLWSIYMENDVADKSKKHRLTNRHPIGCFSLAHHALTFQWMTNSNEILPSYRQLKNYLLRVRVGDHERVMPLRQSRSVPPLKFEPNEHFTSANHSIEDLPPREFLFLEFRNVQLLLPTARIDATSRVISLSGNTNRQTITLSESPRAEVIVSTIASNDAIQISAVKKYWLTDEKRGNLLTVNDIERHKSRLQRERDYIIKNIPKTERRIAELKNEHASVAQRPIQKAPNAWIQQRLKQKELARLSRRIQDQLDRLAEMRSRQPAVKKELEDLSQIVNVAKEIRESSGIHFSLLLKFSTDGTDHVVNLMSSTDEKSTSTSPSP